MKKRLISIILAVMMILGILAGCTEQPAPTELVVELPDLEILYHQGVEKLAEMGPKAPVLFPETNIDYLNQFYPGLADIELKQLFAGVAPVTNAPFEIILVEVVDEADVPTVMEIFQARADRESDDSAYPENAEAWMNNCRITSRGNSVFLAVLMGSAEIPAQFILD